DTPETISAFGALKGAGLIMAIISGTVNVLALTGSFYMLQVYDRVLSSQSIPTLVALSVLAAGLYLFQGVLEVTRSQILVRLGGRVDRQLIAAAHEAAMRLPLLGRRGADAQQPIRDVDTIRGFLSGQGPIAILDMPWMPLYLAFIFLLHPLLGLVTLLGALVLVGLTLWTERVTKAPSLALVTSAANRLAIAEASARNAEVLRAMGFGHRALRRFTSASAEHLAAQEKLSDITSGFSTASRIFRLVIQSGLLGLGAFLVIAGDMSAGAIIASSIAASRAFAPIEVAIGNWKGFVAARQAATRLNAIFSNLPKKADPLKLSAPSKSLTVDSISVAIPGTQRAVIGNISFELKSGQALAVIGPSAAGKSSLARALVGVWSLARGSVRLDGAPLERWNPEQLGAHIGYLPQDVELFDGTITENISRFEEQPDSKLVIEAARAAGVHEMVLRFPDGYETRIGERGSALSAGQRQRIALARALYGRPFLVVLDEPNSNLDSEGEEALAKAIQSVRARNGIVIVVAHRPGVLAVVDMIAVVGNGQITAFGPRDEVLQKAVKGTPKAVPPASQPAASGSKPPASISPTSKPTRMKSVT
ncbi:MAG: type I secretion system permease/ATPase, partial [Hyphomicrobium sp.]